MRKSRISQYKQKRLQALFVAEATARTAAELFWYVNQLIKSGISIDKS